MPAAGTRLNRADIRSAYSYPAAANAVVRAGEPVLIVAGNIVPSDGTAATGAFWGLAAESVNNTGGAAGAKVVKVSFIRPKHLCIFPLAASGFPTKANIGATVYLDATASVITASTGNKLGTLVDVVAGVGAVVEV